MKALEKMMYNLLKETLKKHDGDRHAACEEMGITTRTLFNYLLKWPDLKDLLTTPKQRELPGNHMWEMYPDE